MGFGFWVLGVWRFGFRRGGRLFKVPEIMVPPAGARVMSLTDGTAKVRSEEQGSGFRVQGSGFRVQVRHGFAVLGVGSVSSAVGWVGGR